MLQTMKYSELKEVLSKILGKKITQIHTQDIQDGILLEIDEK